MDCFPGAITTVDTDITHDRRVETTLHYDTVLHDMKVSPDVEQAEVADETIPNTVHFHDEDDNTQPQRSEPVRQRRSVMEPRRLDNFVIGDEL